MAIMNLGLAGDPQATKSTSGYRIYESADETVGAAGHSIYLIWSTEYGSEVQESFVFDIRWRAWEKGRSTRTAWSEPISATIPVSECVEHQPHEGGRVWWSHNLDIGTLLTEIADSNGAFRYDTRLYDSIDIRVSLYSNWSYDDKLKKSGTVSTTCYIGHIPKYEITGIYYEESDLIVIEYDTTWTRQDDRFAFESFRYNGKEILKGTVWGTITAPGRIELRTSALTQHVKDKLVYVHVRWNAAYRKAEMEFSEAVASLTVENHTICNTPTLRRVASDNPYTVSFLTGDSGDLGATIEKVTVKMTDGKYDADEVTVAVGEVAEMRFCPFNTPLEFEAVGSVSKAVSATAKATANVIPVGGIAVLDSIPEDAQAILEWNQSYNITSSGNFELVKLSGRRRPSAFYGAGGHTSVTAQAALIDETGVDIENMAELGDVMLRIHDGRRYALAMEANVSWGNGESSRIKTVRISGEEVDA